MRAWTMLAAALAVGAGTVVLASRDVGAVGGAALAVFVALPLIVVAAAVESEWATRAVQVIAIGYAFMALAAGTLVRGSWAAAPLLFFIPLGGLVAIAIAVATRSKAR